jgi:aminopeptidase
MYFSITYVGETYHPKSIVELSTLTGAMDIALGYPFAGVFTNSDSLWQQLDIAGKVAGDPFWRMPLSEEYRRQIDSNVADLKNVGGRSAGSCTAAIFLNEFVPLAEKDSKKSIPFAHVDIAGVFHRKGGSDLLSNGMTGRPTRSVIEYLSNLSRST